jgi:hypothetical protein
VVTDDDNEEPTLAAGRWAGAYAAPAATAAPPAPDPEPVPSRRDRTRWIAAGVLVALIAGTLGFVGTLAALDAHDSGPSPAATGNGANGSNGSSGTTVPRPADRDASVLGTLIVRQSDVPAGDAVVLLRNGTDAANQPTLDLCNGVYPSEASRTARRQVEVTTASGTGGLSTEAVLYRAPADAARAFGDLRAVVAKCPSTPVVSPVGEDTVTTKFNARPDASWAAVPGVERLAYDFTTTDLQGNRARSLAVYLRRGRVLMGVYFPAPGTQIAVTGKTAVPDIVTVFAKRIAALPAGVVS